MDPVRFDTLARALSTSGARRRLLQASVAAVASGFWLTGRVPGVAAVACLPPGDSCSQSSQCCSGQCNKRRQKCAPLPRKAFGCTIDDASCANATPQAKACPDPPPGISGLCRITLQGRPICAVPATLDCAECTNDRQCSRGPLGVGALCVRCETCLGGTSCICPFFVKQK